MTQNYTNEVVNAIRQNDIRTLRALYESGQHNMNACNRNGETLLHLACRRANRTTIQFLLEEVQLSMHVYDCMGRSPLHDICWRPRVDREVLDLVLFHTNGTNLSLFFVKDIRGHTCLDYCRQEHWNIWNTYFEQHQSTILHNECNEVIIPSE
jgi:ankyrin repeat protein